MNVLSISFAGYHDSSAAVAIDGVLVAAAEEERFTRRKHDDSLPIQAIDYCLSAAGLSLSDIDFLAIPEKPFRFGPDSYLSEIDWATCLWMVRHDSLRTRSAAAKGILELARTLRLRTPNLWMYSRMAEGFSELTKRYGLLPPRRYFDHHKCHAAATYLTSGFDSAAVVTVDGGGGPYTAVAWDAKDRRIDRLASECLPNALGQYYEDCTTYLGFGPNGQGKMMGLASYGDPRRFHRQVAELLSVQDGRWFERRGKPSPELVGFPPFGGQSQITEAPYPDFAASAQQALEIAVHRIASTAITEAESRVICLGGGVMLNCSSNGALLKSGLADDVWVFPAAGDAGLSPGAALLCSVVEGTQRSPRLSTAYLGPSFEESEYQRALFAEPRVTFERAPDVATACAHLLANGHVLGWFQGRMELGPRALGNRSILADPRAIKTRDRVNHIKRRELWRPLAPVVIAERASEYFAPAVASPFMLFAYDVLPAVRDKIRAVVHVDGSARPQTVTRDQNRVLYDLLSEFEKISGIPILLNTSFNDAGEPIVCTPQDAISAFLRMPFDELVLGNFIVRRSGTIDG